MSQIAGQLLVFYVLDKIVIIQVTSLQMSQKQ